MSRSRLLTATEVAERLRISKRAAYRTIRDMCHVQIGGRLLVPEESLEKFIDAHTKGPEWPPPLSRKKLPSWFKAIGPRTGSKAPETKTLDPAYDETSHSMRPIVPRTRPRATEVFSCTQPIVPRTRPKPDNGT